MFFLHPFGSKDSTRTLDVAKDWEGIADVSHGPSGKFALELRVGHNFGVYVCQIQSEEGGLQEFSHTVVQASPPTNVRYGD